MTQDVFQPQNLSNGEKQQAVINSALEHSAIHRDSSNYEENDQLILLKRDLDESQSMFRFEVHAFEGAEGSVESNKEEYYTELLQA